MGECFFLILCVYIQVPDVSNVILFVNYNFVLYLMFVSKKMVEDWRLGLWFLPPPQVSIAGFPIQIDSFFLNFPCSE